MNDLLNRVIASHGDFGVIKFATKRRAYPRNPDNTQDLDRLRVAIDISAIQVS